MPHGGKRRGAGRPPGSKNKRTKMLEEGSRQAAKGGFSPLAYLLRVMRDKNEDKATRLDAAKAAAPYVHPKLSSSHSTKDTSERTHADWVRDMELDVERHDKLAEQEAERAENGAVEEGAGESAPNLIDGSPLSVIPGGKAS